MTTSGAESRSVVVRLSAEAAQYVATMQAAGTLGENAMTRVERATGGANRSLETIGRTSARVGIVAGAGLLAIVGAATRFDKQMSAVQAATHESATGMGELRQAALDAGQATIFSATEAGQGVEELAKAGVSTADVLSGGLRGSLDLAAAGGLDVAEAAETAASALTQFKLEGADVPHVADLLAAGAGKAQGSVHDLGMALNQAGLVASQTGLSIEETTAGLASFASAGLTGSDAGTSFKTMLLALTPQSIKAKDAMDAIGFSAYDAQGQFIGLEGVAQRLKDGLAGMSEEQRNATLKQIFGNDAIRAAAVLYEQGGQGIADWTDKVNDQGYAAETAATRMNNLSGDVEQFTGSLETALINAGESSQNSLRGIVQGATGLVNAFNKAPGPIQSTATSLLAIATATAGGVWLGSRVIRSIADTRDALSSLNETGGKSSGVLRGIAVAGAGLAVLAVGAGAIRAIQQATDESLPGVEALTGRLIALNDAKVSDLGPEFDSLAESLDRIATSGNNLGDLFGDHPEDVLQKPFEGLFGESGSLRQARAELDDLDTALANLATTGGADVAQQAFAKLAESQGLSAEQSKQLRDSLPEYTDALAGASNAAELNASATDQAAAATRKLGDGTELTATQLKGIREAYKDAREGASQTAHAFFNLGDSLDDSKVSLREWLHDLEKQADALANFRKNAETAADKGLRQGLIDALEEAGPAGALRMRQLANATEEQIARANAAWKRGTGEIEKYIDATIPFPKELRTNIIVNNGPALQHIRETSVALQGLNDRTIVVTTIQRTIHQENRLERGHARGGIINGRGSQTSDSVLTPLSAGEYVLQAAAVEKYGVAQLDDFNSLNAPVGRQAATTSGGGNTGGTSGPQGGVFAAALEDLFDSLDNGNKKIDKVLHDFAGTIKDKGVEEVTSQLNDLRKAYKEAGGKWTDAMADEADRLIEVARRHDVTKALKAFDINPADGLDGARSEIQELRKDLKDAGVEWTKQMIGQAGRLTKLASAHDLAIASLGQAQANLESILSEQSSYSAQVAKSFDDSAFGNGLAGFDLQTSANTNDTTDFNNTLQQLATQGLDGDLFKQLASSGDLTTAMQLLATGPAGIALREQAFAAMIDAQNRLGGFAGDQVFGADRTAAEAAVTANAAAVTKLETQMGKVEHTLERTAKVLAGLKKDIEDGAASGSFEGVRQGLLGRQQLNTARVQNGGR